MSSFFLSFFVLTGAYFWVNVIYKKVLKRKRRETIHFDNVTFETPRGVVIHYNGKKTATFTFSPNTEKKEDILNGH